MPILNNALAGAAGSGGAADFKIERSLRFNRDDDAHLSRTFAAGNRKTWTWSGWIKLGREQTGGSSNRYTLFECTDNFSASGNPYGILNIVSGMLGFGEAAGGAYTTAQFRDHSAWYHVVAAMDTTQSTAADRLKLYVNGVQYTHTGYTFGLNADTAINQSGIQHNIGREENSDIFEADLLMAEVHFVDGLQLNCTEFGEFDADTGVWNPIKYTGSYNDAGLNYATVGSYSTSGSQVGGPLANAYDGNAGHGGATAANRTFWGVSNGTSTHSGFSYAVSSATAIRVIYNANVNGSTISVNGISKTANVPGGGNTSLGSIDWSASELNNTFTSIAITSPNSGVGCYVSGIELDGNLLVSIPAGANGFHLDFSDNSSNAALGTDSSGNSNTWTVNNLAANAPGLSTANQGFNVVTYSGNGSNGRAIDLGFQPDFLWIKRRDGNLDHGLWDSVRGSGKELYSNRDYAEGSTSNLASFTSTGFTANNNALTNQNGYSYVAWAWKAGGSSVSNTNGTITSSVSANNTYGFSVVTYTGNSTAGATIGHGLSTAPSLIIIKNRSRAANWAVGHSGVNGFANGNQLRLNTTGAVASSEEWFNNTNPTSSVFTVKNNYEVNYANDNYVAYCWSEVSGFSKFGGYSGNSDNTNVTNRVIDCGFKPKYVLIKCSSNAGEEWMIFDGARNTSNPRNLFLKAESTNADGSYAARHISFVDNGFKFEGSNGQEPLNLSGRNYIFAAYADVPDGSIIDSLIDTPTDYEASSGNNGGNYCTLNPLHRSSQVALTNSNLDVSTSSTSNKCKVFGTIGVSSGKWYYEVTIGSNYRGAFGWATDPNSNLEQQPGDSGGDIALTFDGNKLNSGSYSGGFGTAYSSGMVVGVRVDADTGEVGFSQNGTDKGTAYTVGPDKTYWPIVGDASSGGTFNGSVNFGQRPFAYTPPTGYKALCTTNLNTPLIADPSTAFDVALWTGNGSTQNITNFGFSPDLAWIKGRSFSGDHALFDTVRGATKRIRSNQLNAENTDANTLTAFNSDGFSLGSSSAVNNNTKTFVAWTWDAGDLVDNSNSSYNQSQTWSNGWTGQSGTSGRVPTNAFDGDLTTWAFPGNNGANQYVEYSFTAIPVNTSLEFYLSFDSGGAQRGQLWVNDTNVTSSLGSGNAQWFTVTGQSTLSKIKILTTATNYYVNLHAVRVDGKILIDPGLVPAGSLNSSVYNTSENWVSTGTTTGTAYNSSYSFSPLFDGDLTGLGPQSNSASNYYTYTFANALSATADTIIFYSTSNTANVPSSTGSFQINGTQVTTSNCTRLNNSSPYKYRMNGLTTLSSISSQQLANMTGIEVNGKLLVDSNAHTPPNVPTIGCTVRANPTAGFSIVKWNGTGSSGTVHHGLNAEPGFIVCKKTTGVGNWPVYHLTTGRTKYLYLNSTIEARTYQYFWNNTKPTSSVFTIGNDTDVSHSGETHVAYCISPVAGYSAVGSYTGNSSRNFQHTGFQPRWIMIKTTSITAYPAYTGWAIFDSERQPHNVNVNALWPNNGNVEGTRGNNSTASAPDFGIDILSNGFCLRDNGASEINLNGESYIYLAFAENPFKTARAR